MWVPENLWEIWWVLRISFKEPLAAMRPFPSEASPLAGTGQTASTECGFGSPSRCKFAQTEMQDDEGLLLNDRAISQCIMKVFCLGDLDALVTLRLEAASNKGWILRLGRYQCHW